MQMYGKNKCGTLLLGSELNVIGKIKQKIKDFENVKTIVRIIVM